MSPAYSVTEIPALASGIQSMDISQNRSTNSTASYQGACAVITSPTDVIDSVPFQLSPVLKNQLVSDQFPVTIQTPNWNSYDYDFSLEKSVLKDT